MLAAMFGVLFLSTLGLLFVLCALVKNKRAGGVFELQEGKEGDQETTAEVIE